ncbi:MAG: phosphomannomutase [Selenomonadaceae bacterium]|nr:phosphomannomutase [Selenomonadaceae bacterium]
MPTLNLAGFGPYDIRGIYPTAVNEELFYRVGRVCPSLFGMKKVALGRDIRLSSPSLRDALVRGLTESGAEVWDIGQCGTEMIYFTTVHYDLDGGFMVTASHNPKEYNGLKIVRRGARPLSESTGLGEIKQAIQAEMLPAATPPGKARSLAVLSDYTRHILSYIDVTKLKPLKVVVNVGNGAAGFVVDSLAEHLPFDLVRVHWEADGHFPNGVPNPLRPENRAATIQAVREAKADVGVAWDGDFDRCFLFDEKGGFIEGYYMVGFLAEAFLRKEPGATIIHDPRLTWNTIELVEKNGGKPVVCRSGHAFIKDKMRELDAAYGGELSAHHYFRDFSYCDSGMIPWLLMMQLMSAESRPLSELMKERQERYPASGEVNSPADNPQAILAKVEKLYARQGEVSHIDGLSVEMPTWRFNLRPSGTEPEIRLNVESRGDRRLMEEKTNELLAVIRNKYK